MALLAGAPLGQAAARAGITTRQLSTATAAFRAAGQLALNTLDAGEPWISITLDTPDRDQAERCATTILLPALRRAEGTGSLESWWFVRKSPQWRWRLRAHPGRADDLHADITTVLDNLTAGYPGTRWRPHLYEPETAAFGGAEAMDVAHWFFHTDSRAVLDRLRCRSATGRSARLGDRETSLLVCTALLRGAGLDWHEQGDVWARVAELRPITEPDHRAPSSSLAGKVRHLLQLDTRRLPGSGSHDPYEIGTWLVAAREAGMSLRNLADHQRLHRGIRAVLAHHIVFHWNRIGLSTTTQTVLSRAATTAVFGPRPDVAGPENAR